MVTSFMIFNHTF